MRPIQPLIGNFINFSGKMFSRVVKSFFKRKEDTFEGCLYNLSDPYNPEVVFNRCAFRVDQVGEFLYKASIIRDVDEYVDDDELSEVSFNISPSVALSTLIDGERTHSVGVQFILGSKSYYFAIDEDDETLYDTLKVSLARALISARDQEADPELTPQQADHVLMPMTRTTGGNEMAGFTIPQPLGPIPAISSEAVVVSCRANLVGPNDAQMEEWVVIASNVTAAIVDLDIEGWAAGLHLAINSSDADYVGQTIIRVTDELMSSFQSSSKRYRFLCPTGESGQFIALGLEVEDVALYEALYQSITRRLLDEARARAGYTARETKPAQVEYLVGMMDDTHEGLEDEDVDMSWSDEDVEMVDEAEYHGEDHEANTGVIASKSRPMAFVSHGNTIEAVTTGSTSGYTTSSAPRIEQKAVWDMKDGNGRAITPKQMMLQQQDAKMVVVGEKRDSVYVMDVERGKVIEEYAAKVHDVGISIDNVFHRHKDDERSAGDAFCGLNGNQFWLMDPRLSGANKLVDTERFTYQTKMKLSCAATSASGLVAIGTKKGEIKLYNAMNKRAKTNLPGLGHPIIGIDVTKDGKWVVATTETYLILVQTEMKGEAKLGFEKAMPISSESRKPIRLSILQTDVAALGGLAAIHFSPARFDASDAKERFIVAGCGSKLLVWDMLKIIKGAARPYVMQDGDQAIVDTGMHYGSTDVVVALNEGLKIESRKKR